MIKVRIGCTAGSAKIYSARLDGQVIVGGQSQICPVSEADPSDPRERIMQAWERCAVGADGRNYGSVFIEPLDTPMVVRTYREVNHFLEPDAEEYTDVVVGIGEQVNADTVQSNVVTLMPLRVAAEHA